MTNEQQADMTSYENFATYLNEPSSISVYQNNIPFKNKVAQFIDAYKQNKDKAAATNPDNSGYSDAKNDAKVELSESIIILTAPSKVALEDAGMPEEAEKLCVNASDYRYLADSDCKTLAKKNYNVMKANGGTLIPDIISQSDLDDLLDEIENFGTLQGESGTQHELSPLLTAAFEESFGPCRKYTAQLKLMGKRYLRTNKPFYDGLIKSAEVPAVNVHHTYVNVTITDRNGRPMEGIVVTLDGGNKSATTDYKGEGSIEQVRCGNATLICTYNDKIVMKSHIKILRGKKNFYTYKLDMEQQPGEQQPG